ncbi:N-(5'-phosphoribosyl)anthranilate isomerase, partial [Pseudomonas sp. GP01-A3]
HGDESPAFCQAMRYPFIKAIRIESESDIDQIAEYHCDYILVDSPLGPYRGGNGTTFDWNLLSNKNIERKLILAGGLTIDNVLLASEIVKPVMVDV